MAFCEHFEKLLYFASDKVNSGAKPA